MARKKRNLGSIDVTVKPSFLDYSLITFPSEKRDFFPGYKTDMIFETNIGPYITHVTSDTRNPRIGDPEAGQYICGRLRKWFKHNDVQVDDQIRITQLEKHVRYQIRKR